MVVSFRRLTPEEAARETSELAPSQQALRELLEPRPVGTCRFPVGGEMLDCPYPTAAYPEDALRILKR